jgi:multiple sugar transport system ATP-binding protein
MAKLILENVTKKFGEVTAVNDLSLEIQDGEFLVLLGPSGAGKTTTLKLIAGVERPDSGLVYIGDKLVNPLEPQDRNVAMAFESYALYPHYNVYKNMAFPLRAPRRNFSDQEVDKRVRQVAELLNISNLLERSPAHLSNGQRQRVALGRAMVRDPELLLLDEPISHLDAKLRHRMRAEFKAISAQIKTTILYVTHDYLEALSLPDRVAVIDHGKLQQLGSPDDIFKRPVNIFVASLLGQPKINLVKCRVKGEGDQVRFIGLDATMELVANGQIRQKVQQANLDEVVVGIRPFHLEVDGDGAVDGGTGIQGKVYVYERLGTRGILTMNVGGGQMEVITPIDMDFEIDAPVQVKVDVTHLMVFDPKTEKNILLD